jgi:hypothetical protein
MTITTANIDIGDLPNDGTGDPLRTAFEKINDNFAELLGGLPEGPEGSFQFNDNGNSLGTANLVYVPNTNTIQLGSNIVPIANVTIGTTSNRITGLYLGNTSLKLGNISVNEANNTISFPITVLPSSKASIAIDNVTADGNVSVGDTLIVGATSSKTVEAITTTNAPNQPVVEILESEFGIGTFKINSRENASNNSQSATIVAYKSNTGLGVRYVVSNTIFIGASYINYNVLLDGYGNVQFAVSPTLNTTFTHTINYEVTV